MSATTPLLATDPRRLGPYVLLWRLGGGGMGVVYLGEASDERLVAIKVIRPDLADDSVFLARFRREVEAASRVAGFCTARVIDADLDAERPWFVTEYVDGPTLQQAVKRSGALRGQSLSTFALGVAEALDAIHEAGVVHRDLKPSNVLLARNAPKVIDFGIARALDAASLTQTGKLIGTVNWLAPEQLRSDRASPLSDVFAWGGLVAFAATGRPPFGTGPAEVVVHRILHDDADLEGMEGELRTVVALALAKHPEERPPARALLARLLGAGTRRADAAVMASRVVKDTWTGTNAWQQEAARALARSAPAPVPAAADPANGAAAGQPNGAAGAPAPNPAAAQATPLDERPSAIPPPREHPAASTPPAPVTWPPPGSAERPAAATPPATSPQRPVTGWEPPRQPAPAPPPPAGRPLLTPPAGEGPADAGPSADGRDGGKGSLVADLLPGGMARDLLLVFGFAMALAATLPAVRPVLGAPIPAALLILVVGAALLGALRGLVGLALGVLATEASVHGDALAFLHRPRALAAYAFLGLTVLLVGRVAGRGKHLRPLRVAIALAVGYGLVYAGLAMAEWLARAGSLAGRLRVGL
jgi:serine/threonine protein kinase